MSIILNPSKYEWMTPQKRVQFFNIQRKMFFYRESLLLKRGHEKHRTVMLDTVLFVFG